MKRSYQGFEYLITALLTAAGLCDGQQALADTTNTVLGSDAFASGAGSYETAIGAYALWQNAGQVPPGYFGNGNTAIGYTAMYWNSTGNGNTAIGLQSLNQNRTGNWSTASGFNSMFSNTSGNNNSASGFDALACNTSGSYNTAAGAFTLSGGTFAIGDAFPACPSGYASGNGNTASGAYALTANTAGEYNTATGSSALLRNATGSYNSASGFQALVANIAGDKNEASGAWALYFNTYGHDNTASGHDALHSNTAGSYNIGLGANAGYNVTTGYHNIEIGNVGNPADNGTIRIGTALTHVTTYIAGINNAHVTGGAVYISSTGQLGVLASSERYKTAVAPMGKGTEKLQELHPVTFHLKTDPKGAIQYGLIAEEVAKVYPELVIRDVAGQIEGLRYEELAPMLLNEVQKHAAEFRNLEQQEQERIAAQDAKIRGLELQIADLNNLTEEMRAALKALKAKDQFIAQR